MTEVGSLFAQVHHCITAIIAKFIPQYIEVSFLLGAVGTEKYGVDREGIHTGELASLQRNT